MSTVADIEILPDYLGEAKQHLEARMEREETLRGFEGAFLETDCPGCGWHVWAFIVDGPDPVFVDVVCPRDPCNHEWAERVA